MTKLMQGLSRWSRALVRQLPDKPYPSDHPWRDRHDPARPRGGRSQAPTDQQETRDRPQDQMGGRQSPGAVSIVFPGTPGATGTLHIDDRPAD